MRKRLITCYNPSVQTVSRMNIDLKDFALRALVVLCGGVAAALLILRGQAQALAPLALGATLGAAMMGRLGASEE